MDGETTSSGLSGLSRWQPVLWAGVGVLVSGLGVLGYAVVVADGVYPTWRVAYERLYGPWVAVAAAAACAAPAVGIVAWVLAVTRRGARGELTAYPRPPFLVGVTVLLIGIGIWISGHLVDAGDVPFRGDRALLVAAACGSVLVGAIVVHVAATRMWSSAVAPRPWSRRDVAGFVAGLTAVALVAGTAVAVAGEHTRVDATTSTATQAPAVPTDPTRVLWRWSDGTDIEEMVAAGAGVVLTSQEGIVAVDGRTGQERWRYRRTDTSTQRERYARFRLDGDGQELVAVDGGRVVVASLDGRLHAFDAFTGELRWRDEETTAQTPPYWHREIVATDSTVVRDRYSPVLEFAGTDVRTGELTWRYPSEHPECGTRADAIADMVIIHYACRPSSYELVGLDGTTGEVLWSRPGEARVQHGVLLLEDEDPVVLDPRTGRELGAGPDRLALASDSGEIVTSDGSLFAAGDTVPRWERPAAPGMATAATFLDDAVVLVDWTARPRPVHGDLRLTVVDRADGRVRRSFEPADLPAEHSFRDIEVISAPGAVVVRGEEELVGFG